MSRSGILSPDEFIFIDIHTDTEHLNYWKVVALKITRRSKKSGCL